MRTPAGALVWEMGRKNRWGFLVVAGTLLVGLLARVLQPGDGELLESLAASAMVVSFLVTFALFTYADGGAWIAFPARTFALPVRTGVLVGVPMLLGALGITLLHLAWVGLFIADHQEAYPVGLFVVYWVAALLAFQAIVWCLAEHAKSFVVVLLAVVSLFVRLAVMIHSNAGRSVAVWCLGIMAPAAALAAWLGIRRQRGGQDRFLVASQALLERCASALLRRRRPFATAGQAQLWMESRANAAISMLALGAGLVLACAGLVRIAAHDHFGALASAWVFLSGSLFTLWGLTSGVLSARDANSKSLAVSSFLATRPVTSGELAWVKIKLAGRLTLAGWLGYIIGLSFWFALFGGSDFPFVRQEGALVPFTGFVALVVVWCLVGALPLWLTGRIPSPAWAGLLLLVFLIGMGQVLQFLDKHVGLTVALPWLFGFALAAKIVVAAWSFRESARRRLLPPRLVEGYLFCWSLGTICCLAIAFVLCQGTPVELRLALPGAALLVPLARVGLAPLALAHGRHR